MRSFAGICVVVMLLQCGAALAIDNRHLDLVDRIFQTSSLCWWRPTIVERLMTFKLSDDLWQKMLEPEGFNTVRALSNATESYARKQGLGDLEAIESSFKDRNAKRPDIEKLIDGLKDKISIHIEAEGKYSVAQFNTLRAYILALAEFLSKEKWIPKSGAAVIKITLSHQTKQLKVKTDSDGRIFEVDAPAESLPQKWKKQMFDQFKTGGK